ncbi:MAG: hypothetical protein LRZ85_02545 [Alphaproteobacteria bacterium]|nr:hypothetical protein [Alphaproteobacteria bacterium]
MKHTSYSSESGNVFVFILLGVVLFVALAFTVSRGFRGETTNRMSEREITLAASDILSYVQRLERAVSVVRGKNVSESDLSFDNPMVAGYTHSTPQADKHKIFSSAGGGARWQTPPDGSNDGSPWVITGETCVVGLGTDTAGCSVGTDSTANEDLIVMLANVDAGLCVELNKRLNIAGGIPADAGTGISTTPFRGTFDNGTELTLTPAYSSACFSNGGMNYFYSVLLQRP